MRLPRLLVLLLGLGMVPAAVAGGDPLDALWPEHRPRVLEYARLIAAAHVPAVAADLHGEWQVRSIQGTRYGIFVYPYFMARIVERDGGLFFEKTTGSQRRSGRLVARGDSMGEWIFVGARTVNDDPPAGYSRGSGPEPSPADSVGVVYVIGPGRLVMVLDAGSDDYEIYQLRR